MIQPLDVSGKSLYFTNLVASFKNYICYEFLLTHTLLLNPKSFACRVAFRLLNDSIFPPLRAYHFINKICFKLSDYFIKYY